MTEAEADDERAEALVWRGGDGSVLLRLPNGDATSCDAAGNELTARMNGEAVQRDAQGNEIVVRASGEVSRRDIAGGEVVVRLDGDIDLRSPDGWGWIWRRATGEAVVAPLDGDLRVWRAEDDEYPRAFVNRLWARRDDLLGDAQTLIAAADDLLASADDLLPRS